VISKGNSLAGAVFSDCMRYRYRLWRRWNEADACMFLMLNPSTGVPHVLDHIIPVDHPLVCGLTVPWNMQVIDAPLNAKKGNKLHYAFQGEMFREPEQLRMI